MSSKTKPRSSKPRPAGLRRPSGKARVQPAQVVATPTAVEPTTVVGIGASAGGLEALKTLFSAMPPKTGLAFVVVTHLDPTHDSLLPELLAKASHASVEHAHDGQPVEADHVYVMPPNCTIALGKGQIRLTHLADRHDLRGVIDNFLRSLAADQHDNAVAIILSGTGTDGTLGLAEVKGQGGMVMVQSPDSATQAGMPHSAIATGLVDFVLPPEQMPKTLLEYVRTMRQRPSVPPQRPELVPTDDLQAILAILRARTRHNFQGYRKGTLQRRVEHRMGLHQIERASKYIEFLRAHPDEVDRLFKDLLISVTSFFRDPESFEELSRQVLAPLVRQTDTDTPIRIWVPGCATGEEAYSVAIAAAEEIAAAKSSRWVQVFATDVDLHALDIARAGVYPASIALDMSPQRLARFFTQEDHRCAIATSIRESVVFAAQNVVDDPPFSKLDLVSCRNLLIYLEPQVQEKLMAVFHFALNPGGYLFLGNAEGIGPIETSFTPISKESRIFRRVGTIRRSLADYPRQVTLPDTSPIRGRTTSDPTLATLSTQGLLEHFAPAAVVARRTGQIVHLYGAMDRYITLPAGEATLDVLSLTRPALRPTVRVAFHDAVRRNRQTVLETSHSTQGKRRAGLRVTVRPLGGTAAGAERLWLLVFEDLPPAATLPPAPQSRRHPQALVRRLEAELSATKKEQQRLVAQLENSNEAQRAVNEEVLSMNEELQSANEELVTSKEELQSLNEELATLNAQLQAKVNDVVSINDDLANLLLSTDMATLFLDEHLTVKRFTSAAGQLLNLRTFDLGRPITHIATNLVNVDLSSDAQAVLADRLPIERAVDSNNGQHFILRVLPYRSESQLVRGVVLTLSDVTTLKNAEAALVALNERVSTDLRRMSRLNTISTRLLGSSGFASMLNEIVRAAIEIVGADTGHIQVRNATGRLTIAAQHGFEQSFVDSLNDIGAAGSSADGEAFARGERVIVEDVTQSSLFRDSQALSVLLVAGVRSLQSTPLVSLSGELLGVLSTHWRSIQSPAPAVLAWLDPLARQAADLIERNLLDDVRAKATELEMRVKDRTKWLTLMHDVSQAIDGALSWSDALQVVISYVCEAEGWQIGHVYVPAADAPHQLVTAVSYSVDPRFAPFLALSQRRRYLRGEGLSGRVFDSGQYIWINDQQELLNLLPLRGNIAAQLGFRSVVVLPVQVGDDMLAVVEFWSDESHPESEELLRLMRDVNMQMARVIERERVTLEVGEIIWGEQQDLVHTLHDTLGQQLTGLGMLAASLTNRLKSMDEETRQTAQQIARGAQEALEHVRQLSRGLFPTDVDAAGFVEALRQLAATTESLHKVRCSVEIDAPIAIPDGRVATQLYRIVQEAITNALRHADAEHVTIRTRAEGGATTLMVIDDGVGIHNRETTEEGIGLRIMQHRAVSIGAVFSVGPGADGGTIVACRL